MSYRTDVIDELLGGQQPRVDPYQLILEDYIEAWIEDCTAALLDSKSRLYRQHRQEAISKVVAGCLGDHEDTLITAAARMIRAKPEDVWMRIYLTAIGKAREARNEQRANRI